jgi:alpha-L-fucosidase 2
MTRLAYLIMCVAALLICHPSPDANGQSILAEQNQLKKHGLHFGALPRTWDEGIPLGNGLLGALVWQRDSVLRIALDRADLWDSRPIAEFARPEFSFSWVTGQFQKGDYKPVQDLFDVPYDRDPAPTKLPAGALEFPMPKGIPLASVDLRLEDAVCVLTWKDGMRFETFVEANKERAWFRIRDVRGSMKPAIVPPPYTVNSDKQGEVNSGPEGNDLRRLGYPPPAVKAGRREITYRQNCADGSSYLISVKWSPADSRTVVGCWTITHSNPYILTRPSVDSTHGESGDVVPGRTESDGVEPRHAASARKEHNRVEPGRAESRGEKRNHVEAGRKEPGHEEGGSGGRRALEPSRKSYEAAYRTHAIWWKAFWNQSSIRIPDSTLERQWYLEQYKFGSTSRRGAPPITLQAVWTADNGRLPPWKGDFHNDLNTQLSYWPCYSANHLEEGLAFLDWLWQIKPVSERYTKTYFGTSGLNVPGVATLAGEPMGGWIQYSLSPTVSAWLTQHFYLHWRYSLDTSFLLTRAYPWTRAVAVHLDDLAIRDSSGKRQLPLSSSPEINDNRITAWFRETTNFDISLIRWLYGAAEEMALALGKVDEAQRWQRVRSEWPDLALSDSGKKLLVAPGVELLESHRHFSHLMAIHPLGLLDWDRGGPDRLIIAASLADLERLGTDWWCGYSYSWLGSMWARARNGEKAALALRTFATCFCLPNSFHANGDQSGTGKSKFTYRPFTLEGNFAFAAGLQEMLLQSQGGILRLFPAIPASWKEASFRDFRAEGAFLVTAAMRNGSLDSVRIFPEKDARLKILNPYSGKPFSVTGTDLPDDARNDRILMVNAHAGRGIVFRRIR